MHEFSIVQHIIQTLERELKPEEQRTLKTIIIHLGELSNVQPLLLQSAFQAYQEAEQKWTHSTMMIEQIPVEIYCSDCRSSSRVKASVFKCAHCGKPSNDIVKGDELLIHKLEFNPSS